MPGRKLLSLHVGKPQIHALPDGKKFRTSLFKSEVCEQVWLGAENLHGNYQANLRYHGGPDKAVCCYPGEHYEDLNEMLGLDLAPGALGENFTLAGMLEDEVCLGDRYRVGDAIVEISQPRQPCNSLVKRWGDARLIKVMVDEGFTGYYARVIEEGMVQPGEPLDLLERPLPRWTISALNEIMFQDRNNQTALAELAELPQLATDWRRTFRNRLK